MSDSAKEFIDKATEKILKEITDSCIKQAKSDLGKGASYEDVVKYMIVARCRVLNSAWLCVHKIQISESMQSRIDLIKGAHQ